MDLNKEWDLSQLGYKSPTDSKIKIDFHLYENSIKNFSKKWNIDTADVIKKFGDYLYELDNLSKGTEFWNYLGLLSSLDCNDAKVTKINQELSMLAEPLSELMIFTNRIELEIGYEKMIKFSEKYPDFKNMLNNMANAIKHMLSEKEELVMMKISSALEDNTYDEYSGSLSFDFNGKVLSYPELWAKRGSEDREERKLAYTILAEEFAHKKNESIFSNQYSKVCRANVAGIKLRKMDSVMESRNMSEEMDDRDVNTLLDRILQQYPLYHKFLKLKAKALGLDKLETYDISAPIVNEKSKPMSYEEGSKFYLDTIKKVDQDIYNHSLSLFENKRIDAYPKQGKTGGAFCSYTKGTGEWVLLNWDDTEGYVPTLAHELGHAYHGHLSNKQNYANYGASLCLSETASIFNETAIFNALLEESDDQVALIANRLDDLFSTIFRQVAYIFFERECHNSWLQNVPLSAEDYNTIWLDEMMKLYGDSVNIDPKLIQFNWMNIPHIYHTPFYCYAYSFGNLLALNVYSGYQKAEDKKAYMDKYKEFLSLGGSKRPKDAVKDVFGLDISSNEFYDLGFDHIKELTNKLEELL